MPTLSDQLIVAIQNQRAEIARIKETNRTELEKANLRLTALMAARDALTPEVETVITTLAQVGIKVGAEA